ncbi:hypothetical protein WJX81_000025 [Elliptochloris bilobata]|uniref:J domain-containing protein n=1 Tax=Elliptochloris bilobata TaxID=381761 RepID=A0AAW1RFV3_9CHLO
MLALSSFRVSCLALAVVFQGALGADPGEPAMAPAGEGLGSAASQNAPAAATALATATLCAAMACAAVRAGHWSLSVWLLAEAALTPALVGIAFMLLRLMDRLADAGAAALRGTRAGKVVEALRALGLARGAGADEVKQTYRNLAKGLHPDRNPDPAAHERFREISAARRLLLQEQQRGGGIRDAAEACHARVLWRASCPYDLLA